MRRGLELPQLSKQPNNPITLLELDHGVETLTGEVGSEEIEDESCFAVIPERTRRARELRMGMTGVEWMVWNLLRARQVRGLKFRRQHPIGVYFLDFVCLSARIVVEIDGPHHDWTVDEDASRDRWLETKGYRILRFTAEDVLADSETVSRTIEQVLDEKPPGCVPAAP